MGLQIALVDHPEAELVGKIEHPRVRWIVAGPDGVDPGSLHHDQVGPGVLLVEHPTPIGMGLVPVHPAEDHLAAVDLRMSPSISTVRKPSRMLTTSRPLEVTVAWYSLGDSALHGSTGPTGIGARSPAAARRLADAQLGDRRPAPGTRPRRARSGGSSAAHAVGVVGPQPEVVDRATRAAQQGDVAEDARQPPLVLVLQIAHRRPLVDPDDDHVRAGRTASVTSNSCTSRLPLPTPISCRSARPGRPTRRRRSATGSGPRPSRAARNPPMIPGRVLVRDMRRVDRKRVLHIGVDRAAVAARPPCEHPVRRNGDACPRRLSSKSGSRGGVVERRCGRGPAEPPLAVEAEGRRVGGSQARAGLRRPLPGEKSSR